jgi:hypothetical protein
MAIVVQAGVGVEQGGIGNAGVEGRCAVGRRNNRRAQGQVPRWAAGGLHWVRVHRVWVLRWGWLG